MVHWDSEIFYSRRRFIEAESHMPKMEIVHAWERIIEAERRISKMEVVKKGRFIKFECHMPKMEIVYFCGKIIEAESHMPQMEIVYSWRRFIKAERHNSENVISLFLGQVFRGWMSDVENVYSCEVSVKRIPKSSNQFQFPLSRWLFCFKRWLKADGLHILLNIPV